MDTLHEYQYTVDYISLNYSNKEKCFRQKL